MKENLPKQNPSLGINVFRHGKSRYKQEEVLIEEARDLTAEGVDDVKKSAEALVKLIKPDEEVEIWSSPMGRTLQTAKIIAQVLEEKQVHIRKKGDSNKHGIKVFEQFSEVKNFSWKLFYPLVAGGEVEFAGNQRDFLLRRLFSPSFKMPLVKNVLKEGLVEFKRISNMGTNDKKGFNRKFRRKDRQELNYYLNHKEEVGFGKAISEEDQMTLTQNNARFLIQKMNIPESILNKPFQQLSNTEIQILSAALR